MKASVKLRREDPGGPPPLLRAKLPVAALCLPFVAAASAGAPRDLSFQLRTAFPAGPSLRLSYHPHQQGHPFSITLRSGVGPWGSPSSSPLLLSAHLPIGAAGAALSFSIQIDYSVGDFSLKKAAGASAPPAPNPPVLKENGDGVHGPPQWTEVPAEREGVAEERTPRTAVTVRTTLAVARKAAVRLRWAVKVPRAAGGESAPGGKGLPFLAVDKISIERSGKEGNGGREKGEVVRAVREEERDEEALKGMLFWMRREVEELQREQGSIRESLEELRRVASASAGMDRGRVIASGSRRQPSRGV